MKASTDTMHTAPASHAARPAIAIDIDLPFQHVLAAWLAARCYRVTFLPLAALPSTQGDIDLVVCELSEPKVSGAQTLRRLAQAHPQAILLAISARFVAAPRCETLARSLGADAALAKPFSRLDLYAALDALPARGPRCHGPA
jgi:CheY-like chemotaxis protein